MLAAGEKRPASGKKEGTPPIKRPTTTANNGVVSAHGKGRPTCVAPGKGYPTGDENIAGTHEKGIHACDTKESSVEATRPITATESVAVVDTKEETASDRRDAPEYT